MVRAGDALLKPDPFGVRVVVGAVAVIPVTLLDVIVTAPVKALTPAKLTLVDESLLPRAIVTLAWLRATLKPAGAIVTGILTEWQVVGKKNVPQPATMTDPLAVPLTVRVSEPVVEAVRSTEPVASLAVRPADAVTVSVMTSEKPPREA
jgi:hypothetical protein